MFWNLDDVAFYFGIFCIILILTLPQAWNSYWNHKEQLIKLQYQCGVKK